MVAIYLGLASGTGNPMFTREGMRDEMRIYLAGGEGRQWIYTKLEAVDNGAPTYDPKAVGRMWQPVS